jgi:PAS domain S-box-containing protein
MAQTYRHCPVCFWSPQRRPYVSRTRARRSISLWQINSLSRYTRAARGQILDWGPVRLTGRYSPAAFPDYPHRRNDRVGYFVGLRYHDKIRKMPVDTHVGEAAEDEVRRLRTLYQLLSELTEAKGLEDVYSAALKSLLEATTADRAAILLFDEAGVMRFKASRGLSAEYQAKTTGHTPWPRGALNAKPLIVPDVSRYPGLASYRDLMEAEGIQGLAFIPLALDTGVFGKFMLYYAKRHDPPRGELEISQAIATHVALATQHKRAELACARSQQQLQAILDHSPAVIFLKDVEGRYLLVNKRHEELFHLAPGSMIGRKDHDIFPAETANLFQANDRAVLAAGEPITVEESAPHDDGVHSYVTIKFPLRGPDGTVTGVCGIATDISERKHAEIATRHLAAIVESSADAIIAKDLDGLITSWNKGAERIFGYTAEEVVGKPVAMLAAPERLDEMPELLAKVRRGDRIEHYETRRRRKDGQIIDVALSVSPVRDSAGKIIGASKIARDITARKAAEHERMSLLAREQESRRIAELLNLVGPRLTAHLDQERLVQEVTDIATSLVGAEFGSFFHNVINEKGESYMLYTLSGVPREAFAQFPMPRNTAVFAPTFQGEGVVRCDDVTKDPRYGKNAPHHGMPKGHLPVRSYLAVPVVARTGEVLGGLFFGHSTPGRFTENHEAIVTGIAAQTAIALDNARLFKQAEWAQTELKRSNEELRRTNRDLETFAYSASHDLQEPLRNISISAQFLERSWGQQLQGNDVTFLSNILTSATRMEGLIKDLLAYAEASKSEEGQAPRIESKRVLNVVVENLYGMIQETGARVSVGELPSVAIHESRLGQLFQNLISNAIKYRGKEAPRVDITAAERDGWCIFSVADNGIGIDPEYAEKIFGLFKRLHGRDEYPGSGIGLAICQRVVEQYGGRIWLEQSELGRGSTFCFSVALHP